MILLYNKIVECDKISQVFNLDLVIVLSTVNMLSTWPFVISSIP
jgi:hypothetical protein